MACSRLIDPPDKAMKFDLEEMESDDAQWYMGLPQLDDHVGSMANLRSQGGLKDSTFSQTKKNERVPRQKERRKAKPGKPATKVVSIQEVSDESASEDEDLVSYEKPDTDASDSEEDPTLIQRSKPNAPVWVSFPTAIY